MRKTASNDEVWQRRQKMFEEWCSGTPVIALAQKYDVHRDQVRQDIDATIKFLRDYDGLERMSASRQRVLAQLWREVETAARNEARALRGLPAETVDKDGDVVSFKLVDAKAAAAYQGNRIKALQLIERLMCLGKSAPGGDDEKHAATWSELIKKAWAARKSSGNPV